MMQDKIDKFDLIFLLGIDGDTIEEYEESILNRLI